MPRHVNPNSENRTAIAPYNFVPLPNEVLTVEDGIEVNGEKKKLWKHHDEFVPATNSGWIDLKIKTLTPLYIRGPVQRLADGSWDRSESRLRPEPFQLPDGCPVIPGSSLRGMIRTLVEIMSFAKLQPVSRAKPFFRTVAKNRIGDVYRHLILRGGIKPRGGFIRVLDASGAIVIEPCEVLRVDQLKLQETGLHINNSPTYTPPWSYQHKRCWIQLRQGRETVSGIRIQELSPGSGWIPGTLVLTGNVPNKKREFVFLDPVANAEHIIVPMDIWERFHDKDQITQWQEKAFPKDCPQKGCRKGDGYLRDGEPIFYLTDAQAKYEASENPDMLVFLGRAQMFRFPYDKRSTDLIPDQICEAGLDLAEAIFGYIDKAPGKEKAIKGRVIFEDAVAAVEGGPDWFDDIIVPHILSSPKVTAYQHYLTQDGTKSERELTTYLESDFTTIRGHKLYWHRWNEATGIQEVREQDNHDQKREALLHGQGNNDTQHTIIKPIKTGVTFHSRIRFENLADLELGVLLAAIELPHGCAHKLGMGKPLGLGSVQIEAELQLIDRQRRYRSWLDNGVTSDNGRHFREAFKRTILEHAKASGETLTRGNEDLRQIARLDALFIILNWSGRPDIQKTGNMKVEQFRNHPVLPTPHKVAGEPEPSWPNLCPRPSDGQGPRNQPVSRVNQLTKEITNRMPASNSLTSTTTREAGIPPAKIKPIQQGQTREGTLHRDGNTWTAYFAGDTRTAVIINPDNVLSNVPDGSRAEFYIVEQNKKVGIMARLERL